MKILMLIDKLGVGGTETHVLSLCNILKKFNFETIIIDLYECRNIAGDNDNSIVENLINIIRLYKVDLIHCHGVESITISRNLYNLEKIPYIITVHGLYYRPDILRYGCEKAKHIIAVSKPVKDFIIKNIGFENINKVSLIYNGIKIVKDSKENNPTLKEKLKIPQDAKVILYCSRLSFGKGNIAEILIHQVKDLLKGNVYLLIIGDGVKKKSIDFYANQFNKEYKEKKIITLGSIYNVNAYYLISDIVVGTGRVAIEALNFSKPVICFGLEDYVGLLCPKNSDRILDTYFGDHGYSSSIEKLNTEDSIRSLLDNKDRHDELSKWSKTYCDNNFDWEKLIYKYIDIII